MDITPITKTILSAEIAQKLQDLIMSREFEPGAQLPNELDLAKMMGVSRSTIREAIKILASNNILEVVRGKGTFVGRQPGLVNDPLGVNFLHDQDLLVSLFEARLLIEPGVAFLAAERATPNNLQRIEESVERLAELIRKHESHAQEDQEFHRAVAIATQNPIIDRIVPIINDSIAKAYFEIVNIPGNPQKVLKAHQNIYKSIKNRNTAQAKTAMRLHLDETMLDIRSRR